MSSKGLLFCGHSPEISSTSCKDINPFGLGPPLLHYLDLTASLKTLKTLSPNTVTLGVSGLGFQHINFGEHKAAQNTYLPIYVGHGTYCGLMAGQIFFFIT